VIDLNKTEDLLKRCGFPYELIYDGKPIPTAKDGAEHYRIDIGQMAPALILYTPSGYYVLVFSGEKEKVDFKELKKLLNCKNLRLATREEVIRETGFTVGSVPMFGIRLPHILDNRLLKYPFVYGGSGIENTTLKIDPHALFELNDVIATLD
jgi:prolyl-tRNA editing enzyme YbaK/EbsC (Cys-tRNA(Pro) deacylase)